MRGNIFNRINKDEECSKYLARSTLMFKGRVPDPEKSGKTKLIRKLVPVGEVMNVRDGEFVSKQTVTSHGHSRGCSQTQKNRRI